MEAKTISDSEGNAKTAESLVLAFGPETNLATPAALTAINEGMAKLADPLKKVWIETREGKKCTCFIDEANAILNSGADINYLSGLPRSERGNSRSKWLSIATAFNNWSSNRTLFFGIPADPTIGRFLQTDPVGSQDDLNLYAYANDDALNKTDPTGEFCWQGVNAGSVVCQRNARYENLDNDARISNHTRFFAAASVVTAALATPLHLIIHLNGTLMAAGAGLTDKVSARGLDAAKWQLGGVSILRNSQIAKH